MRCPVGVCAFQSRAWASPLSLTVVPSASELVKQIVIKYGTAELTSDCLSDMVTCSADK